MCLDLKRLHLCLLLWFCVGLPAQALAQTDNRVRENLYRFDVTHVADGDTFRADVPIWLNQNLAVKVRVFGIDAPELKGKCAYERAMARKARQFTKKWLEQKDLYLTDLRLAHFKGRALARVVNGEGEELGAMLLARKLAKPYSRKKADWCGG